MMNRYHIKRNFHFMFCGRLFCCILLCCFLSSGCAGKEVLVMQTSPYSQEERTDEIPAATGCPGLCVYVCGAVENPGVYDLPVGSRIVDALEAAGGFREDASEVSVNLAQLLRDEEKIFVPSEDDVSPDGLGLQTGDGALVNINTADEALLCTLPGIGRTRALAIISYREANGPFSAPEEIMQVSGIKENMYEKLKDSIVVR